MEIKNRFTGETIFKDESATIKETAQMAIQRRANLSDADLRRADLSGANLRRANLIRANLRRANLIRANLRRANLIRANLRDADLSGADLSGANLSGADLSRANLRGADLSGANLSGADLSGADLSGADLPKIDRYENLRGDICARVCATPQHLEMSAWHTCETTHCLAGWATVIHPQGRLLESIYGTSAAAAIIFHVCEGEVPDFHSDNETAMKWLKGEK